MLNYYYADIKILENPNLFETWMKRVQIQRREKVLRCKNKEDKKRILMAGILLRVAVENAGISYENAEFSKTETGKPFLLSEPSIFFSLSHAGTYAGCVISDTPVGLDIENMEKSLFLPEREHLFLGTAQKCMSMAEWKCFETEQKKRECFLEYWTKKEAYSKYIGKGLSMDFSLIDTESMKEQFWTEWTTDGYCMSICTPNESPKEVVIEKCMMN